MEQRLDQRGEPIPRLHRAGYAGQEAKSDEYIEKNVKNQKVDSIFSDLKTESKSAFIESLKAFQAQNPNFLSNIVNKELSRKYWAYGIIA